MQPTKAFIDAGCTVDESQENILIILWTSDIAQDDNREEVGIV